MHGANAVDHRGNCQNCQDCQKSGLVLGTRSEAVLQTGSRRGDEAEATRNPTEEPERALRTENAKLETRNSDLEAAQRANTLAVLDFVLSHTLRLFHPFLPFITEELWHGMGYHEEMPEHQGGQSIMHAPWPKPLEEDFKGHYGLDVCGYGDDAPAFATESCVPSGANTFAGIELETGSGNHGS